jgi:hypothetical protein
MALGPEPSSADAGPTWPVSTLNGEPHLGHPANWPTVDLSEGPGKGVMAPERAAPPQGDPVPRSPEGPSKPGRGAPAKGGHGAVASLQARSLGELVSGAIAAGFVFVVAASVVSAFARIPAQGVRARLLVAFNYATFYVAVALLFGMVCLLLLARSAARGGLAQVAASGTQKRPVREVLAAVLAAESALVGLGSLVSFILYLSLAGSLPDAGVGHMLAEISVLPVVIVTLLWGWAGGTAKLRRLFGVGGPLPAPSDEQRTTGPLGPPPVATGVADRDA